MCFLRIPINLFPTTFMLRVSFSPALSVLTFIAAIEFFRPPVRPGHRYCCCSCSCCTRLNKRLHRKCMVWKTNITHSKVLRLRYTCVFAFTRSCSFTRSFTSTFSFACTCSFTFALFMFAYVSVYVFVCVYVYVVIHVFKFVFVFVYVDVCV